MSYLGDSKHGRKRGRPMKPTRPSGISESPNQSSSMLSPQQLVPPQTPQAQTTPIPSQLTSTTPTQSSPPKTTPKSVIKALPTVRDHTTDQLGPQGDEYIPREYDEQGEKKVTSTGHLLANRQYKCQTFYALNRGDKLFMLATECARVLGYRDSYLLFNKNRSLYKIIASQAEKEDLIQQEILPFSYRSRQIAIVTAKSMFRQFGSRVINNGRRVRDDYWEGKARKQGFTEEDLAGEKRPGAAKARDAAAAEASASLTLGHGEIVYSNHPNQFGSHPQPQTVQPGSMMGNPGHVPTLPSMTLAPEQSDMRVRDYSNIQRPRQEISGQPYQDRTQSSQPTELLTQAHQAADYNKQIGNQRNFNQEILDRRWRATHTADSPNLPQAGGPNEGIPPVQVSQSPRASQSTIQQSTMSQQPPQHIMGSQPYSQAPRPQNPVAQSPMRAIPQGSMRSDHMGGSGLSINAGSLGQGGGSYGYSQQQGMWPPPQQAQQSPSHTFPSYNPHGGQQSPHIQQSPQHPPPQLRNPQMQPGLQYPGGMRPPMGQGYPAPGPALYNAPQSQQFMQATTAGSQPGAESWSPQQQPGQGGSWGWSAQQQ
jgi:hypothetical protein